MLECRFEPYCCVAVLFEKLPIAWCGPRPASEREYPDISTLQSGSEIRSLDLAVSVDPFLVDDLGHGASFRLLDQGVEVQALHLHKVRKVSCHARLAHSHEARQCELYLAHTLTSLNISK